jgi:hypothetical protein
MLRYSNPIPEGAVRQADRSASVARATEERYGRVERGVAPVNRRRWH